MRSKWGALWLLALGTGSLGGTTAAAQETPADTTLRPPVGREAATALEFSELDFRPPEARREEVRGVPVLFVEDHTLPLVDVYARFEGGFANFPRDRYAAATGVPALIRSGGTLRLPPDSVDALVELYALQTTFGSAGEGAFSQMNTLSGNLGPALRLWAEMLREPRFDSAQVEVWRGQTLERVRRRGDNPRGLAFSEFNRLMFGDHPTGWEMAPSDLEPDDVSREALRWVHRRVFCPENMYLGITGDVTWSRARELLDEMLAEWPGCPEPVPEAPDPELRREGGVFLIPRDLGQSTVVMAEPGGVRRSLEADYFASRIANSILGGGGFSSRLMERVRTEEGFAYSASSLWTAPASHEGIVGAITQTRAGSTIAATRLILEVIGEMTRQAPEPDEVRTSIEEIVNGFVFNFQSPGQIVSRQLFYLAQDLPANWLERYLEGIQAVDAADVHRVMATHVDPSKMTVLILGDPERFDAPADSLDLGEPRILEIETPSPSSDSAAAGRKPPPTSGLPRGSPRSRR